MNIPRVAVLLSSYNGAIYIEEQIKSIILQKDVQVTIYVRDDGSSDSTVEIISRLASIYSNILINVELNIGLTKSFFNLLCNSSNNFDYYAFADQDDVWLPDKLSAAVQKLASVDGNSPAMYCSRTEYVDEYLRHISYSKILNPENVGFGNALVQNIATGCTIVVNSEARKIITRELPEKCIIHDWWIYLVVSAFGVVIYDPVSYIKYRQHAGNVIGASSSFIKNSIKRARRFFDSTQKNKTSLQIAEFYRIFNLELTPARLEDVSKMLIADRGVWSRIVLVCERFYWRQSFFDDFLLRIVMISGRF